VPVDFYEINIRYDAYLKLRSLLFLYQAAKYVLLGFSHGRIILKILQTYSYENVDWIYLAHYMSK
jgi:hypothetical protein